MSKELPYFKFEPAEYLTKDISFCSLSAQGLFINICSYYWQRNCELTKDQLLRRLNYEKELNELISEGVIDLIEDRIFIKFLNKQLSEIELISNKNSINGSKGGRPKKNLIESQTKPKQNPIESQTKGIREDKIKEDKEINANLSVDWEKLKDKFNSITGKKTKIICDKAKRQIKARLKEGYTKLDLLNAIENCFKDPYHKDNPKYLTLEFISRPDKFEKYCEEPPKQKPKQNITL